MKLRILALALVAAGLAGCGPAKQETGASAAEIVPASAPIFLALDSDLRSSQWQTVDELLDPFSLKAEWLKMLRRGIAEDVGVDYERDVKPALGAELDVVWLDFQAFGTNVVAVTKPKDEDKFAKLVEKINASESGPKLLIAKIGAWTVVSDTEAKIQRLRDAGSERLADDERFKAAMAELPEETLVRAYGRDKDVLGLGWSLFLEAPNPLQAERQPEFVAVALAAEDKGVRLVSASRARSDPKKAPAQPFTSKLVEEVPGDAVIFGTFRGGETVARQVRRLTEDEESRRGLRELETELGFRLEQVLPVFEHESAFYVRKGTPSPELTLLLEAPDEQQVFRRVDKVLIGLTTKLVAQPCHAPVDPRVSEKCIDFDKVTVRYAAFHDRVVVTTGRAVADLLGRPPSSPDPRLSEDELFRSAVEAAKLPEQTTGFLYVLPLGALSLLGELPGADAEWTVSPPVLHTVLHLRGLVVWTEQSGRTSKTTAFLRVD